MCKFVMHLVKMVEQQAAEEILQTVYDERLVMAAVSVAQHQQQMVPLVLDVMEVAPSHDLAQSTPVERLWC